jgi:hypothetical protein
MTSVGGLEVTAWDVPYPCVPGPGTGQEEFRIGREPDERDGSVIPDLRTELAEFLSVNGEQSGQSPNLSIDQRRWRTAHFDLAVALFPRIDHLAQGQLGLLLLPRYSFSSAV